MKICFYLQRRFAYLGHDIAAILKQRYGVSEFCGYVETRESLRFLQSQQDITYTSLVLDEEVIERYKDEPLDLAYLQYLKVEYGTPNLWPYILHDRVIRYSLMVRAYPHDTSRYTHEEMMRMLQVTAKAIEKFFDDEKPDAIYLSVVSGLDSYLLYAIAKKRGIRVLGMYHPRLDERYALTPDYFDYTDLQETIRKIREHAGDYADYLEKARSYLAEFQAKPQYYIQSSKSADTYIHTPVSRKNHFVFLRNPRKFFDSLTWLFRSYYVYFSNPHRLDYSTVKPWHEMIDKLTRKWRVVRGYRDLIEMPREGESYAFFALQNEPEGLPMLLSPFYSLDQIWVVKQLARSLPLHFKLYVKDHPVMVGRRTRAYYKELRKIPNVRVIDPAVSGLDLTQGAQLVSTITGTAGQEAALLGKPTIIFSPVFYSGLPNVRRCRDIEQLPQLVEDTLAHPGYDEERIVEFIAALYKESIPLDLTHLWHGEGGQITEDEKQQLIPLADLIASKLGLQKHAKEN